MLYRFSFFTLFSLSCFTSFPAFSMEEIKNELSLSILTVPKTQSEQAHTNEDKNKELTSLIDIRGFQCHYKTLVTEEEWNENQRLLLKEAQDLSSASRKNFVPGYLQAIKPYFLLYKNLLQNQKKTLKHLKEKELLGTLSDFTYTYEMLNDAIMLNPFNKGKYFSDTQRKILPIIQRTFNLYMQAYERLTGKTTSFLESLHYKKVYQQCIEAHLFYKRNEDGFFIFPILPYKTLGKNLFLNSIAYIPAGEKGTDEVCFSMPEKEGEPQIVRQSGFIYTDLGNIEVQGEMRPAISFHLYYGELSSTPFFAGISMLIPGACDAKEQNTPYEAYVKSEIIRSLGACKSTENLAVQAAEKSLVDFEGVHASTLYFGNLKSDNFTLRLSSNESSLYRSAKQILEKEQSTFVPLPSTPVEELESEYLYFLELQERISRQIGTPEDMAMLEYFKETDPETYSEKTAEKLLKESENALLEAYIQEEQKQIEQQIRKEQEERSQNVATGKHYKPTSKNKNNKGSKHKFEKKEKSQKSAETNEENILKEAKNLAAGRLNSLKLPKGNNLKFRKFLDLVNTAQQELANVGVGVKGALNKSSHGSIAIEGSKSMTIVRPHGRRDTISPKKAKGILNGLCNSLFEVLNTKK